MDMKLGVNENKKLEITAGGKVYERYAIKTHYVQIGEDYTALVEKYVKPHYQAGDILSISEKIIALCQKRIIYKSEMKVSFLARFLSRFAMRSDAGIGVDSPYKMQYAIDLRGRAKVIYAAVAAGIGKLFGKKGIFYDIVGQGVSGLDGFYGKVFPEYGELGIMIPENSAGVCSEIYEKTGIPAMIVDANDLNVDILGKADVIDEDHTVLRSLILDNPAGQSRQLTPFILIRGGREACDSCRDMRDLLLAIPAAEQILVGGRAGDSADAAAAALALTKFLRQIGKSAHMLPLEPSAPPLMDLLDISGDCVRTENANREKAHAFILISAQGKSEPAGGHINYFDSAELSIAICRHECGQSGAEHALMAGEAGSVSEILFQLLKSFDEDISAEISTLLYMGIAWSTASFTKGISPSAFRVAADLLERGADPEKTLQILSSGGQKPAKLV